jgi:hypothetical protein
MHATVRIASEEIQYETTIAARCDIDTCTLWIREEYVKHNADRSISTHWVEWLPFWSYQASGRFARFDYPPTSSPPNWMSDITLPGSSEQTDISITVTAMMDPRPFCDHLHTDFYTFNDIKIGTAWLAHVGLA